jgi:hypothetical protein
MGYLTPVYNINHLRSAEAGLSIRISPDPGQRAADGSWPVVMTVQNTTGEPVTLTRLLLAGVDRSAGIRAVFGGNHMPAHASAAARMKLSGYTPPLNLVVELDGEEDDGRPVTGQAAILLQR